MSESLGDAYPKEQARLRECLGRYQELRSMPGVNVSFALAAIEDVLRRADEAAISGDLPAMIRLYQEMQGCE